jgi:hypothetical protein
VRTQPIRALAFFALLGTGCVTAPGPLPTGPPPYDPSMQGCRSTPPLQLTFGGSDEDGTYVAAKDGRYYYAWATGRNDGSDIYLMESLDGETWSRGRPIIATPRDDYMVTMSQRPDGMFQLSGGIWGVGTGLLLSESRDTWAWSPPRPIADMGHAKVTMDSGPGAATLQVDRRGRFWLMYSSNLTGNKEIWIKSSDDNGRSWSTPVNVSQSPRQDDFLSFQLTPDGGFAAAWVCQEHDPDLRWFEQFHSWSSDICVATSNDGRRWTNRVITSDPPEAPQLDNFPALIEGPGGLYLFWITSRLAPPGAWEPRIVVLPLSAHGDMSQLRVFPHLGFSTRGIALRGGRYLVSWVRDHAGGRDNFFQLYCNFDFGPNPPPR